MEMSRGRPADEAGGRSQSVALAVFLDSLTDDSAGCVPQTLAGPSCRLPLKRFDREVELSIVAIPSAAPIKFDRLVRFNGRSFKYSALPCVVPASWQGKTESVANFH